MVAAGGATRRGPGIGGVPMGIHEKKKSSETKRAKKERAHGMRARLSAQGGARGPFPGQWRNGCSRVPKEGARGKGEPAAGARASPQLRGAAQRSGPKLNPTP